MELIFITTMLESVIAILVLAIIFTASQFYRRKRSVTARGVSGVEAQAVILTVEETGVYMNHHPLVRMQMQVLPDRGRNFVVEIREVLSYLDLAEYRTGTTVRVKYNPSNFQDTTLIK